MDWSPTLSDLKHPALHEGNKEKKLAIPRRSEYCSNPQSQNGTLSPEEQGEPSKMQVQGAQGPSLQAPIMFQSERGRIYASGPVRL